MGKQQNCEVATHWAVPKKPFSYALFYAGVGMVLYGMLAVVGLSTSLGELLGGRPGLGAWIGTGVWLMWASYTWFGQWPLMGIIRSRPNRPVRILMDWCLPIAVGCLYSYIDYGGAVSLALVAFILPVLVLMAMLPQGIVWLVSTINRIDKEQWLAGHEYLRDLPSGLDDPPPTTPVNATEPSGRGKEPDVR